MNILITIPTLIILILSGLFLYLIFILIKINRLKMKKSIIMKQYLELGGLSEEEKEQKEIDEKINDLVKKIVDSKYGKHKVEVMSKNYNWLSSDKQILKSFEYELSEIAPELLQVNIFERLIFLVFKIIAYVIILIPFTLLSAMLLEFSDIDGMIGVIICMIPIFISVFILERVSWIRPIRYNTAIRFFRGYKF